MRNDQTEATCGPWVAVAVDQTGYVLDEDELAEECARIAVVRASAMPGVWTEGDMPRLLGSYRTSDVLYELEDLDDEPDQIPTIWEQAQAVAEALNASSVVVAAHAYYRSGGDVDDHNALMDAVKDDLDRALARPDWENGDDDPDDGPTSHDQAKGNTRPYAEGGDGRG